MLCKRWRMRTRRQRGAPMTVCISAIADRHNAIVSCVDTQISTTETSFDPIVGRKMSGVCGWTILSSGTTSYSEDLVDAFIALLRESPDNNPPTIRDLLEQAIRQEMPKFMAAQYLHPYGITMQEFFQNRAQFTDERWNELSRSMLDYSEQYNVALIVSGWGDRQVEFGRNGDNTGAQGYIFSASRDGVLSHSDDGFYAVGSGGSSAHSLLCYFNHEPHMSIAEAVYHVAAAKFMSERTAGVGANTVIRIARREEGEWAGYFIQPADLVQIRDVWNREGAPRMTEAAENTVVEIIRRCQGPQTVSMRHMANAIRRFNEGE
jgi:hypothetical protein